MVKLYGFLFTLFCFLFPVHCFTVPVFPLPSLHWSLSPPISDHSSCYCPLVSVLIILRCLYAFLEFYSYSEMLESHLFSAFLYNFNMAIILHGTTYIHYLNSYWVGRIFLHCWCETKLIKYIFGLYSENCHCEGLVYGTVYCSRY